jgi:putative ABC transport system permease protein
MRAPRFFRRWRSFRRRDQIRAEIVEELRQHEDRIAERLVRDGWREAEARREAARRMGNRIVFEERGYDVRAGSFLEALVQDVRYGARALRANRAFTLVAVTTLALGIGANTAIFSVASGVLLRPLPYRDAQQLSMVWMTNARIDLKEDWHSYPNYDTYRRQSTTFEDMAIFNRTSRTITGGGEPERVTGAHGSANLFSVLGVTPHRGRVFTAEEDRPGANDVIVLSHGFWTRRFAARDDVINSTVMMSGRSLKVVGVMPPGFSFPQRETDFWVPTGVSDQQRSNPNSLWLQVVGRRKPGVSVAQAQADLERVNKTILDANPNQKGYGISVTDYRDQLVGRVRPAVLVLFGAVGFVLLIACANVASLLMARASARHRELALRSAIGAGRGRLIRQLLTESVLLASLGAAAGLALAWFGLRALIQAAPPDLPRLNDITIDGTVLLFTLVIAVATGVIFGLVPAMQAARRNVGHSLKEGDRGATSGRGVRRALVTIEVALAVVLLVGSGLMIRSFVKLQQLNLGFQPKGVLSARVALWGQRYGQPAPVVDFYTQLMDRLNAAPNVQGAAAIGTVFLSATPNSTNFSIEGRPPFTAEESYEVPVDSVTPGYFRVMGVPIIAGRDFDARDTQQSTRTVIINDAMAKRYWPDQSPLGGRITYGGPGPNAQWMEIVGVVADTRRTGYESAVRPETYIPHAQNPSTGMMLVLRSAGDPMALVPTVRQVVKELEPNVAVQSARPITDLLAEMTSQRRLNTILLTVFGVVAGLLASVGIYGVLAYSVQSRTRELGVRLALGASGSNVVGLVLREGLTLAGTGLVLGLAGAFALTRTMESMLYHVRTFDPATFAAIAGVAVLVSLAACLVPAWRALRVDPITALRTE